MVPHLNELAAALAPQLQVAGFKPVDHYLYRRNGHELAIERDWLRVESSRASREPCPGAGMLGRPGLWRPRPLDEDRYARVFELPATVFADGEEEEADFPSGLCAACLSWAVATARGLPPADWSAPPLEQVRACIPEGALTVRAGAIVREGEIEHSGQRLAIRCPILLSIPDDLPAPRRHWLLASVLQAQRLWRLVRVGIDESTSALMGEVDLTGAPECVLESLLPVAVDSLRWVVSWAAKPAAAIVSDMESDALAVSPMGRIPGKEVSHD